MQLQCFLEFYKAVNDDDKSHDEADTAHENVVFYNKKDSDSCGDKAVDHAKPVEAAVCLVGKVPDDDDKTVYNEQAAEAVAYKTGQNVRPYQHRYAQECVEYCCDHIAFFQIREKFFHRITSFLFRIDKY